MQRNDSARRSHNAVEQQARLEGVGEIEEVAGLLAIRPAVQQEYPTIEKPLWSLRGLSYAVCSSRTWAMSRREIARIWDGSSVATVTVSPASVMNSTS